jgi:tetratricopeptide (TPR) repeat protein
MLINRKCLFYWLLMICFMLHALPALAQDYNDIAIANEYFLNKETEKARSLYEDLIKKQENIPLVHSNYFNILLNQGDFSEAQKYIDRMIKRNPHDIQYRVDVGRIYSRQNDKQKESKYFNDLINEYKGDVNRIRILSQFLVNSQMADYAIIAYKTGRKQANDPHLFSLEMANTYRYLNNKQLMVDEYLNFAQQNSSNQTYVQNMLQNILTDDGDLDMLETYLIDKVQAHADNRVFNEMLIWLNLQQRNFYGAFIQARAIDKRLRYNGSIVLDVGMIALENRDYENSIRMFEYVVKEYPRSMNYAIAKSMIIKSREEMIKNTFPVDENEIRRLVFDYEQLIKEIGIHNNSIDAIRNKALLHAFYLDEFDTAIEILENLVEINGINQLFRAKCKLDLGDIYLLLEQPWESTLLYSQVEKSHKETSIGYEAKLRNAKLSFYKGEFILAQEHLDILKQATSREIANDAMDLSLLIQDNTVMDTSGAALREYAAIELMLFRNKKMDVMDALAEMLVKYRNHSITDEVLFLRAQLSVEFGNYEDAIQDLEAIIKSYTYDILSDDAFFLIGKIYEEHMNDKEKAMEIYQEFLKNYPGSIYVAEARSRFRKLRGDFSKLN